jgi:hypothetical protein
MASKAISAIPPCFFENRPIFEFWDYNTKLLSRKNTVSELQRHIVKENIYAESIPTKRIYMSEMPSI